MDDTHVLIVEDDPNWLGELVEEVRRACHEHPARVKGPDGKTEPHPPWDESAGVGGTIWIHTAASFPQCEQLLSGRTTWKLVVTDIALQENGDKFGKKVARRAQDNKVACLVVSGSLVVNNLDVRDLLREYGVYDFFDKRRFDVKLFHAHVRKILFPDGPDEAREVAIGFGEDAFVLRSQGAEVYLPRRYTSLFACFAVKVHKTVPGEEVDLTDLNDAVGEADSPGVASGPLRKAINRLNDQLRESFGLPPDGETWIRSTRGSGYALNTGRVRWGLDPTERLKGLGRASQSVYSIPIDPTKMQDNTADDD